MERKLTRFAMSLLLFVIIWVSAAATHQGFYSKWTLGDFSDRFSIEMMVEGSAHKPFVFRQLAPAIARTLEQVTPTKVQAFLEVSVLSSPVRHASWQRHAFTYWIVYYIHFLALVLAIFVLRAILLSEGVAGVTATLAPCILLLFMPYLQTVGGFFYDGIELFFLAGAVWLAKRRKLIWLAVLTGFATYNKESFLLFIPALFPFLRPQLQLRPTMLVLAGLLLIAGLINLHLKIVYAGNPGGNVEVWFTKNMQDYFSLLTYFKFEETYGLPSPKGVNLLTLLAIVAIIRLGWRALSQEFRNHSYIALAISFPLFLVFCFTGELRNFSFLYISLALLLANAIEKFGLETRHT